MIAAIEQHAATLLPSGQVLVTGGIGPSDNGTAISQLYDPVAGSWTQTGAMSVARFGHTATLLPSGKVLVTGGGGQNGSVALASAEIYDPLTAR